VWGKLPELPTDAQHVLRLCLITGQRIGEVAGMRRDELAHREWRLPGSRTKNGHAHVVPLSDIALAEIAAASPDGDRIFKIEAKLIANLVDKAQPIFGISKWVPHDLRRTALTQMASLGVEPIVLANVANHRSAARAGVTFAIYVKHSYEKEKRHALDLWADRLRAIVGDEPVAKVIPLATGGVR
jgi:integrase